MQRSLMQRSHAILSAELKQLLNHKRTLLEDYRLGVLFLAAGREHCLAPKDLAVTVGRSRQLVTKLIRVAAVFTEDEIRKLHKLNAEVCELHTRHTGGVTTKKLGYPDLVVVGALPGPERLALLERRVREGLTTPQLAKLVQHARGKRRGGGRSRQLHMSKDALSDTVGVLDYLPDLCERVGAFCTSRGATRYTELYASSTPGQQELMRTIARDTCDFLEGLLGDPELQEFLRQMRKLSVSGP